MNFKLTISFILPAVFMLLVIGCGGESQTTDTPAPEAKVVAKVEVESSPTKESPKPAAAVPPTLVEPSPTKESTKPAAAVPPTAVPTLSPVTKTIEIPKTAAAVSKQTQEKELPKDITWTTVADEDGVFSISVPSEWETNVDVEELSAELPAFIEAGVVPFLVSIDTETGSNLMILMDAQYMFAEESIDVETYIQLQIEDLKQTPGTSGISTHSVSIDGIKGTQIRYTMTKDGLEVLGRNNMLIGDENETRMLCGYIALQVQAMYVLDAQLSVLEKAIESLRILPTAAGELESCD